MSPTEPSAELPTRWTLVIPCFNEAARLDQRAFDFFLEQTPHVSLIFVNDGSQDGTDTVLQGFYNRWPNRVDVLTFAENRGKAEAVREGMLRGIAQVPAPTYLGYWDADLATPLDVAPQMVSLMQSNSQINVILGARVQLLGRDIQRQWKRHYLGRVFATVASIVLGLRVYDTQCGAKLFRQAAHLKPLFDTPFHSAWIFDVELLARWKRLNLQANRSAEFGLFEFPLHQWHDVPGSKLRLKHWFRAALDLYRISRHYRN